MADKGKKKPKRIELAADAFEREVTTDLDDETPDQPKGMALHSRILIGLAVGVIAGVAVNRLFGGDHARVVWVVDNITGPLGQLFLRLLLMIADARHAYHERREDERHDDHQQARTRRGQVLRLLFNHLG